MENAGLNNEAYALRAIIFFVVLRFPWRTGYNLLMRKFGAEFWIGTTTLLWGFSAAMARTVVKPFLIIPRTLLGAAEAGCTGMIYLTSQWFWQLTVPAYGAVHMGAPLALTLGSPLSGALLEDTWFYGARDGSGCCYRRPTYWLGIFTFSGLMTLRSRRVFLLWKKERAYPGGERRKVASRLADALRNGRDLATILFILTIQVAVYGLIFSCRPGLPRYWALKLAAASVVTAARFHGWRRRMAYSSLLRPYAIAAFAAVLLAAGIGIGLSGLVFSGARYSGARVFFVVSFIAVQPVFWTMPTQLLSGRGSGGGVKFR